MQNNHHAPEMIDYALEYAGFGWRVLPLHSIHSGDCSCGRENCSSMGKHPRVKNGVKEATSEREQITRWWTQWPGANIGLASGGGVYVIDIDCSKGGSVESLAELGVPGLEWTFTVRTGSGGYHLYLRCAEDLPNTAGKLAPFVDTRGAGGYIVAPPSRNKYGSYSRYCDLSMQPIPERLLARLKAPTTPAPATQGQPLTVNGREQEDHPYASQTDSLEKPEHEPQSTPLAAPALSRRSASAGPADALAQEARNNFLIQRAGYLRRDGYTAREICAMLISLNEARYSEGRHPQGPLPLEEMQRTIFKSVAEWERLNGVLAAPQPPQVLQVRDLMNMDLPPVNWIVPELLAEGLTLLAGKPKVGKSWLILGLALACSLGTAAGGGLVLGRYPVEPMGVLYLTLEDNAARLRSRMLKILAQRGAPANFGYALRWKQLTAGGLEDLDAYLLAAPDTRLLIIDTLAKVRQSSGNGSSGNLYQEESDLMSKLQVLANTHHLAVVVVHHLRKMGSDDVFDEVSGTLGLTGGADTTIILKRARYEQEGTLAITGRDVEEQELAAT
ncbi:MAG TPA: bifunctional DNA primase/polymerase, partial [Ktedonobacteraceae bacterium]